MLFKSLTIVALCLALTSTTRPQEPAPVPPPAGPEVALSLIVTDKNNKGLNSIRQDQVRVFESKVEQTILSIEPDERPVDYVLAVDSSGSLRSLFPVVLDAARILVINRRPSDEIALVRFISSDKIQTVLKFTNDGDALIAALKTLRVEGGVSAVIDGLYTSVAYVAEHNKSNEARRKVVIIITDGEDRNSYYKEPELIKLLREEGVQVFILGLTINVDKEAGFIRASPRERAEKLLKTVAEESGGRVFFPQTREQLAKSATEIIMDLRAQYRIKYRSMSDASKKGFRKVDVKFVSTAGEKLNLIVPRGYFVGPKDPPKKSEKK